MRPFLFAFMSLCLAACTSTSSVSSEQRRARQMRVFDGTNVEQVFRAFRTVLLKEGHVLLSQDVRTGVMVAGIQRKGVGGALWRSWGRHLAMKNKEQLELTLNLEQVGPKSIETRLSLQRLERSSLGGQAGEEILDDRVYRTLYSLVAQKLIAENGLKVH